MNPLRFWCVCISVLAAAAVSLGAAGAGTIDLADAQYRSMWLSHPAVGEASFDSFVRLRANPIHVGSAPYLWPVNGFLFQDPASGSLNAYVGLYPKGYWGIPAKCALVQSVDAGATWQDRGVVLEGSPTMFDGNGKKPGGAPDISMVYDAGVYHMLYDWCDTENIDGGLAYARAEKPEGPFVRAAEPIHRESKQKTLLGIYKRLYGGTLVKRQNDWLILSAMSLPRNAGGTWAMAGLTAPRADGPYNEPALLIYPQSRTFLPVPLEFFPAFLHGEHVYAPATSLANRNFQVIFRAKIEEAHLPERWEVYRHGSAWHAEPVEHEALGIWGQTFSGFIGRDGVFQVLFPSKNSKDVGTIGLARRAWDASYRNGFVLSATEAHALTIFQKRFKPFRVEATLRCNGPKTFIWAHSAPLGTNSIWHAGGGPHPLTLAGCNQFVLDAGGWRVQQVTPGGQATVVAQGSDVKSQAMTADVVALTQEAEHASVSVNGRELWRGALACRPGSLGFIARNRSVLFVDKLLASSAGTDTTLSLLPTEAVIGAGCTQDQWTKEENACYRFGFGYHSGKPAVAAKWNYVGRGFALWSPRNKGLGSASVFLDGQHLGDVNLKADKLEPSSKILEKTDVSPGFHALTLLQKEGTIVCDSLEVSP